MSQTLRTGLWIAGQTPLANALAGVAGTLVTGLLASLVIAAFHRKRERAAWRG
jgi:hypothetical protein